MAVSQQQHYFTPLIIPPPSRPKIRWRQKHIETYIYCFPFSILFNASSCFSSFHLLFVFFDASLHSRDGSDEITPPSHRVKTSACTYLHSSTHLPPFLPPLPLFFVNAAAAAATEPAPSRPRRIEEDLMPRTTKKSTAGHTPSLPPSFPLPPFLHRSSS